MEVYWIEQNAGGVPVEERWLSGNERARMDTLRVPKRRADWRLGRWTAKLAVSGLLELPRNLEALARIELRPAPSGAPEVFLQDRPMPMVLSLSHSSGVGFCAIAPADAAMGCDLETVEPRSPAFLADYFTEEERELVERTPAESRDRLLTLLWSAKEGTLKALRCGLRSDTRSVSIAPPEMPDVDCDEWCRLSATHIGGQFYDGWWRESRHLIWTVVANPTPRLTVLS